MARIVFGADMNIQAPPNLSGGPLSAMIGAGINDWGGVSPVTPDHVNPEKPWPALDALAQRTSEAGKVLVERLAIYPAYIAQPEKWLDASLRPQVLRACDAEGFARSDDWIAGAGKPIPSLALARRRRKARIHSRRAIARHPCAGIRRRDAGGKRRRCTVCGTR